MQYYGQSLCRICNCVVLPLMNELKNLEYLMRYGEHPELFASYKLREYLYIHVVYRARKVCPELTEKYIS